MIEFAALIVFFAWLHPASEHREETRNVAGRNLYLTTLVIGAIMVWAAIKGLPAPLFIFGGLALIFPWAALFTGVVTKSRYAEQVLNWIGLILFTFFDIASMFA